MLRFITFECRKPPTADWIEIINPGNRIRLLVSKAETAPLIYLLNQAETFV